jgi:hypothetical protein
MNKIFLAASLALMIPIFSEIGFSQIAITTTGAPHEFDAICGTDSDTTFRIYEGHGLLQSLNDAAVSFKCVRPPVNASVPELLWSCAEVNPGERGYRAEIRREPGQADSVAKIIQLDAAGTERVETLSCS